VRSSLAESSAGLAKPPTSPSSAMKTESRRIDRVTATAVTSARNPKAVSAPTRFQTAWLAHRVA